MGILLYLINQSDILLDVSIADVEELVEEMDECDDKSCHSNAACESVRNIYNCYEDSG